MICLGGILGTFIFGATAARFGKKVTLILLVIPHVTAWVIIIMSSHIEQLYVARVLQGLTGGGMLRTVPLFIAEISENRIRGKLGSTVMLFFSSGALFIFIAGTYLNFFIVPCVVMIFPTLFLVSMCFLHDTPASLMSRKKPTEAFEALKFYRTCGTNEAAIEFAREEFELLRKASDNKDYEKAKLSDLCKSNNRFHIFFESLRFISSGETCEEGTYHRNVPCISKSVLGNLRCHNLHIRHFQEFRLRFKPQRIFHHRRYNSAYWYLCLVDLRWKVWPKG